MPRLPSGTGKPRTRTTRAQASLAFLYYSGKGVAQDEAEAVKWFQKAAAQNEASAYPSLAWAYYQGKGVVQDYAEAAKWFREAAEGGDAQSKYMLGYLYEDGKVVQAGCRCGCSRSN